MKRTELVIFPSSTVMRINQLFTFALDTSGAAHDFTVIRFVNGQAYSGLVGAASMTLARIPNPNPGHPNP